MQKYDATIDDMRKKLELKKVVKDSEKLAIESKSVVDFKVPEIPIKKIQEIYNNSDLLRSKSESDLILNKSSEEKLTTKYNDALKNKPLPSTCDEDHEWSDKSFRTKSNSEEIPTQVSAKRSSSQSSNISEEILSEAYSDHAQTVMNSIQSYVSERIELEKNSYKESNIEEDLTAASDDTSAIFSKRLDHIQLNNKELNDDIHNLEIDLKELTEMMSNFSKKSDDKTIAKNSSVDNTSKTVSEELKRSESVISYDATHNELQSKGDTVLSDAASPTDNLFTSTDEFDKKVKPLNEFDKCVLGESTDKISEEISEAFLSKNFSDKDESPSSINEFIERKLDSE